MVAGDEADDRTAANRRSTQPGILSNYQAGAPPARVYGVSVFPIPRLHRSKPLGACKLQSRRMFSA